MLAVFITLISLRARVFPLFKFQLYHVQFTKDVELFAKAHSVWWPCKAINSLLLKLKKKSEQNTALNEIRIQHTSTYHSNNQNPKKIPKNNNNNNHQQQQDEQEIKRNSRHKLLLPSHSIYSHCYAFVRRAWMMWALRFFIPLNWFVSCEFFFPYCFHCNSTL